MHFLPEMLQRAHYQPTSLTPLFHPPHPTTPTPAPQQTQQLVRLTENLLFKHPQPTSQPENYLHLPIFPHAAAGERSNRLNAQVASTITAMQELI